MRVGVNPWLTPSRPPGSSNNNKELTQMTNTFTPAFISPD